MGLVAPPHVGSSQTRDGTRVPCTGRRILNHCATREIPTLLYFNGKKRESNPSLGWGVELPPEKSQHAILGFHSLSISSSYEVDLDTNINVDDK